MSSESATGQTSVIVVTADSGCVALAGIRNVLSSNAAVELMVVDNASQDGLPTRIEREFAKDARLRVVRNERNLGFGAACNQASWLAGGETLLFLNPDCLIGDSTIAGLQQVAATFPDAGLLGVQVVDSGGKEERANRRQEPLLWRALATATGLSRFQRRFPNLAGVELPSALATASVEVVDAVSGACMMVSRRAFDAVGGFDEGYFLHCEDLDLCRRIRDAGFKVLHVPSIRVMHAQGSSSRSRPTFVAYHKHRSMWRYFRKFDPAARNPVLRLLVWFGIWAHFSCMLPVYAWRRLRHRREPVDEARQEPATRKG